jgi:hypothetical protein
VRGTLHAGSPKLSDGSHYDSWTIRVTAPQRVKIQMVSADFDAYLMVYRSTAGRLTKLAEDDDSGGDLDAELTVSLPAAGEYEIVANSSDSAAVGAYRLTATAAGAVAASAARSSAIRIPSITVRPGGDPSDRYALLVGIDDYPGDDSDLLSDINDVRSMKRVLLERFGFREENILVLTDSVATRENIITGFRQHLSKAGGAGAAVFYYSGHGTQVDTADNHTSAYGTEADGKDEALYVWGSDGAGALLIDDELGRLTDELRTSRTLIILDACFSGTGTRAPGAQEKLVRMGDIRGHLGVRPKMIVGDPPARGRGRAPQGRLADALGEPQRHLLLAASADTETSLSLRSLPGVNEPGSAFTYFLTTALRSSPSGSAIESIMTTVRAQTSQFARSKFDHAQTPQLEGANKSLTLDEFVQKRPK